MSANSFTVKKCNGTLVFNDLGGFQTRNNSTMWCIEEANKIYNWADFEEMTICTWDFENSNNDYTFSKTCSYNKLVPDFNFHAWPEVGINDYTEFINEIDIAGSQDYEINKVGWIGNINTHHFREKLLEIGNNNPSLFEFFNCGNWINKTNTIKLTPDVFISTPELVKKYSMIIDVEGNGYSGRLKHLLWSHRPLLLVDRPHKEYFFEYLKEWEHYIPVNRDLSDLIEKTKWCLDNYEKALQIAENAYQFSKIHLTRTVCYNKWNNIINKYIHRYKMDLTRIRLINESSLEDLTDANYLENLIVKLGFNTEILHEQPKIVKDNGGGLLIWQYPNQFSKYLSLLCKQNISSYIEIGCRWGGTFILTAEYLKMFNNIDKSVAVDLIQSPVQSYCLANKESQFISINSQTEDFKLYMNNNYFDLIFIDGDHSYVGVKGDYEISKNSGRIFVFHDIVNDVCPGVVQFWNELKNTESDIYDFFEFTEQYDDVWNDTHQTFLGIGVAIKK
jgi:cephalosporin hydroxylase